MTERSTDCGSWHYWNHNRSCLCFVDCFHSCNLSVRKCEKLDFKPVDVSIKGLSTRQRPLLFLSFRRLCDDDTRFLHRSSQRHWACFFHGCGAIHFFFEGMGWEGAHLCLKIFDIEWFTLGLAMFKHMDLGIRYQGKKPHVGPSNVGYPDGFKRHMTNGVTWKNAQLKPVGSVRLMSYTYKTIPNVNERESNSAGVHRSSFGIS